MPKFDEQPETFYAISRGHWRQWLEKNHLTSLGIWLIYYKLKSGKPSVQYSDAVK